MKKQEHSDKVEIISAFMDGEERYSRLPAMDRDACEKWQRYHLVGEVLRGNSTKFAHTSIAAKIGGKIKNDIAPAAAVAQKPANYWHYALAASLVAVFAAFGLWVGQKNYVKPSLVEIAGTDARVNAYIARHDAVAAGWKFAQEKDNKFSIITVTYNE